MLTASLHRSIVDDNHVKLLHILHAVSYYKSILHEYIIIVEY